MNDTIRVREVERVTAAVIQMCGYTTNINLSSLCATPDMKRSQTKKENAITNARNLGIEVI
jgi:lipopolysaccharide biosynthesis protein